MQTQLDKLPPGKLIVTKDRNYLKWYVNDGEHLSYLPKSQRNVAEDLARRKYLLLVLEEHINEKEAIQFYLRHHSKSYGRSDKLLISDCFHDLLSPYYQTKSQELHNWSIADYEHNPNYPEQLIHKSSSGNLVRSKSEAFIDTMLYKSKIPFRYECALHLDDHLIYPDFTILHPQTKKIYYWEHFGMMDNLSYSNNVYAKLQLYNSYNIISNLNLITTFETKDQPLSMSLVEKMIEHYFL